VAKTSAENTRKIGDLSMLQCDNTKAAVDLGLVWQCL